MNLLLLLAVPVMATSTGTFRNARIDALDISVNSFLVGRSTVTGIPRFRNGINCTNSTGNCLVFSDGSTQNTAFTGGGSTISVAASLYGNGQSAANPVGVDSSSVPIFQSGKYPPANGSLITGLAESQISNLTTDLAAKASSGTNSDVIGFTLPVTSVASVTVQAQGFSVGTTSFTVAGGSATVAYKLTAGSLQASSASLTATGIGVYNLTLSSSIQFMNATTGIKWQDGTISTTASSGSSGGSTGPAGPASSMTVTATVDNFLGSVNGVTTAFTLSQSPASTSAVQVVLDGLLQSGSSDYTLSGQALTMTTAPAANSSSFYARYDVYTSTLPQAMLFNSTDTVSGAKVFQSTITVGQPAFGVRSSTADYRSIVKGGWAIVASSDTASTANVLFTNLYSSYTYVLHCRILQNTSNANFRLTVNNDTTAGAHQYDVTCTNNGTQVIINSNASTIWDLQRDVTGATDFGKLDLLFTTAYKNGNRVMGTGANNFRLNGGTHEECKVGGYYAGTELSSLKLFVSAGTMTGICYLEAQPWP